MVKTHAAEFEEELYRTRPDYIVYRPHRQDKTDMDNEHFLVFRSPKGDLLSLWTQGDGEAGDQQHIVLSRSRDDGITWTEPVTLAGPHDGDGLIASWAFPIVADTGRIYVIYNQFVGIVDSHRAETGVMRCLFSDDDGISFQFGADLPIPRGPLDHPDPCVPPNWIVWQKPIRDSRGRYLVGVTRHMSAAIRPEPQGAWQCFSQTEFIRFENAALGVAPSDLRLQWFPSDGMGLRVDNPERTDVSISICEEPSLVLLPDGRLFCTMRTMTGRIYYSVSSDDGETWREPEVLRDCDGGTEMLQPIACCPIYELDPDKGEYILLYHNNDGHAGGGKGPGDSDFNRHPAFLAKGAYRPQAHQPIWFGKAVFFCDSNGIAIGAAQNGQNKFDKPFRVEVATYTSFTNDNGKKVLWYPDRKYFLLGRNITDQLLSESIPK